MCVGYRRSRAGMVLLLLVTVWMVGEGAAPALAQYSSARRHRRFSGTTGPRRTASGTLATVDLAGEALVVRSRSGGSLRVLVDDQTQFYLGGSRGSLRDLRSGANVSVTYFQYSGVWVADQVRASNLVGSSRGDTAPGYEGRSGTYTGRGAPSAGRSLPYTGRGVPYAGRPGTAAPYTATGRSQARSQEPVAPPAPRTTTGGWRPRSQPAGSSTTRSQPPPRRRRPLRPPDDPPPGRRA